MVWFPSFLPWNHPDLWLLVPHPQRGWPTTCLAYRRQYRWQRLQVVPDLQEKTDHQVLPGSLVHLDGRDILGDKAFLETKECQVIRFSPVFKMSKVTICFNDKLKFVLCL